MFDTDVKECGLISDHRLIVTKIRIRLLQCGSVRFPYIDLKKVDSVVLEDRIRRSSLFSSPAPPTEDLTNQFADIV